MLLVLHVCTKRSSEHNLNALLDMREPVGGSVMSGL